MHITFASIIAALALAATSVQAVAQNPDSVLLNLKQQIAPDSRTAIWNVNVTNQDGGTAAVWGTVGTTEQKQAVSQALEQAGVKNFDNRLVVLEQSVPANEQWGLVKLSIATLRTQGRHAAEMASQAIMGTPVKVLELGDGWCRVQTPDNYIAWVPESSLRLMSAERLNEWKQLRRCIVTSYDSRLTTEPNGDETVTDLVMGNVLTFVAEKGKWVLLATPDGRKGWTPKADVADFARWSQQDFNVKQVLATAHRMMGSSYLWGGTSTKVTDCSGLTKVSYFSNGIILQRDASQQALHGLLIKGSDWRQCHPGDLLFFSDSPSGRVTHVGIYLGNSKFIHCSGQVKINSLDPSAPDYLYSALSCSRIDGQVGTAGIVAVRNHPWYFNK